MAKEKKERFPHRHGTKHNKHNYIWIRILNGILEFRDALQLVGKVHQLRRPCTGFEYIEHFVTICIIYKKEELIYDYY